VHARWIVDRDLKPENVLVQSGQAVLIDFGLAKRFFAEGVTTTKVIGTPKYMAPEQLQGGPIGIWTDVYSFGVMAFELLSDKVQVNTNSEEGFDTTAPFVSLELSMQVVYALQSFFVRALAPAWKDRFASATEMRAAFECAWAGLSIDTVSSKAPSPAGNSAPPTLKAFHRTGWVSAILGILVILVIASVATASLRKISYIPTLVRFNKDLAACDPLRPTVEIGTFKNSSGEAQWDSFANSVADSLRGHLRTLRNLDVADANSPFGKCPTAWVVDGTVQKIGAKLRLSVEVHDATRAAVVSPIDVDDSAGDTGNVLEKSRDVLLDALRRQARFKDRDRWAYLGTKSEEARKNLLDYYQLVGTNLQPRRQDLEVGRKLIDDALQLDPDYVPALVERAYLLSFGIGTRSRRDGIKAGLRELEHAVIVQPGNPGALVMRCRLLRLAMEFDSRPTDAAIEIAMNACGDALKADHDSAQTHFDYARLNIRLCADDQAMSSFEQVLLQDRRFSPVTLYDFIVTALSNGRLAIADRRSRELVELEQNWRYSDSAIRAAPMIRGAVLLQLAGRDQTLLSHARFEFERQIQRANTILDEKWEEAGAIRGLMRIAARTGGGFHLNFEVALPT